MRNLFFLMVCTIVLVPTAALAQLRCDGGGNLTAYVSGTIDGPSPSAIANVWVNGAVPDDVDTESAAALREAIGVFERQRPSADQAADIAARDWTGWRAEMMSRDEFIRGFHEEVGRRAGTQGDYAAILQAAHPAA